MYLFTPLFHQHCSLQQRSMDTDYGRNFCSAACESTTYPEMLVDLFTYPILLLNVEISSTVNEVPHCIKIAFCSSHMERSCLMEQRNGYFTFTILHGSTLDNSGYIPLITKYANLCDDHSQSISMKLWQEYSLMTWVGNIINNYNFARGTLIPFTHLHLITIFLKVFDTVNRPSVDLYSGETSQLVLKA